jgi:hypothetical protein
MVGHTVKRAALEKVKKFSGTGSERGILSKISPFKKYFYALFYQL